MVCRADGDIDNIGRVSDMNEIYIEIVDKLYGIKLKFHEAYYASGDVSYCVGVDERNDDMVYNTKTVDFEFDTAELGEVHKNGTVDIYPEDCEEYDDAMEFEICELLTLTNLKSLMLGYIRDSEMTTRKILENN